MNKKRKPEHGIKRLKIGDHFHLITLPDGRCGQLVATGILDSQDGLFYEHPEGTIGKVQDINGKSYGKWFPLVEPSEVKYLYVPLADCDINPFGISIGVR